MQRLCSRWQNALATAFWLLVLAAAEVSVVTATNRIAETGWRIALTVLGAALCLVVFGGLAVRAARIGVYGYPQAMHVRGQIRTLIVPWESLGRTQLTTFHGRNGESYYPVLMLTEPQQEMVLDNILHASRRAPGNETVHLWWLAAMTDRSAQIWKLRIDSMIADARSR